MAGITLSGEFKIGPDHFSWKAKGYAGMTNADSNYRGIAARVSLAQGGYRELVIEFHPEDYPNQSPGSRRSFEARVLEYTQKAIESGWRPESRGKPFRFEAEPLKP